MYAVSTIAFILASAAFLAPMALATYYGIRVLWDMLAANGRALAGIMIAILALVVISCGGEPQSLADLCSDAGGAYPAATAVAMVGEAYGFAADAGVEYPASAPITTLNLDAGQACYLTAGFCRAGVDQLVAQLSVATNWESVVDIHQPLLCERIP